MRTLIAALALTFVAGAAFAAEGGGDPFRYTAPGVTTSLQSYKQVAGSSQNPYPFSGATTTTSNQVLPSNGSNGVLQTANSLPVGFEDGVPGQANLNHQLPSPTRFAQPGNRVSGTHG